MECYFLIASSLFTFLLLLIAFFRGQGFLLRFLVGYVDSGMIFLKSLITTVGVDV